jgi:hypothetical protein
MTRRSKKAWAKWQKLVREQERSGQSVKTFCQERALCRPYFFTWKKRLRESTAARFLEVRVAEPNTAGDSRVEIRLRNGRALLVGRGFDAEHVRALLALAEAAG